MNIPTLIQSMSSKERAEALDVLRQYERGEIIDIAKNIECNIEEIDLIRLGGIKNKIQVIKSVRARLNCGLRVAKEAVELLQKELTS